MLALGLNGAPQSINIQCFKYFQLATNGYVCTEKNNVDYTFYQRRKNVIIKK